MSDFPERPTQPRPTRDDFPYGPIPRNLRSWDDEADLADRSEDEPGNFDHE